MIKLEIDKNKKFMRESFCIRADEAMRVSVDVTESGQLIVYGYTGVEDNVEQDPVILYFSESESNHDITYQGD